MSVEVSPRSSSEILNELESTNAKQVYIFFGENNLPFFFLGKGEAEEALDVGAVDFLRPAPIKLFEGFDHWEASRLDPALGGVIFAPQGLSLSQSAQVIERTPVFLNPLLGQGLMLLPEKGEFEVAQIVVELIVFHGVDSGLGLMS